MSVEITLNGRATTVGQHLTVSELCRNYNVNANQVVIELNGAILRPDSYPDTVLKDNDSIELIQFVGGG